ncbi:MAG: methyltransferase domain-containing protein [Candidatus Pacebacteria bacterium]|nr:methyltransferase domain-containing protein [Candidatus Paceibacterota bacterium]
MKNEEVQKILKQTKKIYDDVAEKYASVRKEPWKEMEFLFGKFLRSGDKVLDIGCGNGRFFESFTKNDVNYIGIDNSRNLLRIAKDDYPMGSFVLASALNIPFEENIFDDVYSIAVLHHMPTREMRIRFIEEAKRVLKKGGNLVLTVWDMSEKREQGEKKGLFNIFSLFAQRLDSGDMFIPWYGAQDCYFYSFRMEELVALVEECGLRVIEKGEILIGKKPYNNLYVVAKKI